MDRGRAGDQQMIAAWLGQGIVNALLIVAAWVVSEP